VRSSRRERGILIANGRRVNSTAEGILVVAVVWELEIHPGTSEDFERFYGADGEWTAVSRRSRSFLGSSFLRDHSDSTHYMLIEYWSEMVVFEKHRASHATEAGHLEKERDAYCVSITAMGLFQGLDVPDRTGPTWSQRDGV
jgi:quinol monooxygenase YgiN